MIIIVPSPSGLFTAEGIFHVTYLPAVIPKRSYRFMSSVPRFSAYEQVYAVPPEDDVQNATQKSLPSTSIRFRSCIQVGVYFICAYLTLSARSSM